MEETRSHRSQLSRSAAAEARKRKVLERGSDRLKTITVGGIKDDEATVSGVLLADPKSCNSDVSVNSRVA
jgi:hypothetical protein